MGRVMIHARKMFRPTPQRTADKLRLDPAPRIEPETTCVVLTGKPK